MKQQLENVRNQITDKAIALCALFIAPASIALIIRAYYIGWHPALGFHFVMLLIVLGLFLLRKKISFHIKAIILSVGFTLTGIAGACIFGLSGAHFMVLVSVILSALLSGRQPAIIFTAITVGSLMLIGLGHHFEIIEAVINPGDYNTQLSSWLVIIMTLIFISAVIILSINQLYTFVFRATDSLRKNAQETLTAKNELQSILDFLPIPIGISDDNKNITYLNRKYTQTFGYTHSEVPEVNLWFEKAYPDPVVRKQNIDIWEATLEKAIRNNEETPAQLYDITCKNGTIKNTEITAKFHAGKLIVCFNDITDRLNSEKGIRATEERFRRLSDLSFEGIILHDNGVCIEINRAVCRITGYLPEELIGKYLIEKLIVEQYQQQVIEAIKTSSTKPYEVLVKTKQGTVVPIEIEGRRIEWHGREIRVAAIRDLTERKKAQQKIEEHQLFIQKVTEQSPDIIYVFNLESRTNTYINRDLAALLGYSKDETPENAFELIERYIHPDDVAQFDSYYTKVNEWAEDYFLEFEYRLRAKDNTWRWFRGKEKTFQQKDGKVINLIGTVHDITETKQTEAELIKHRHHLEVLVKERTEEISQMNDKLRQTNEEMTITNDKLAEQKQELQEILTKLKTTQSQLIQSEKMASLGILTAGIAHEINNPVNFITSSIFALESISESVEKVFAEYQMITPQNAQDKIKEIERIKEDVDFEFKLKYLTNMVAGIMTGANRIASIVSSLRTFTQQDDQSMQYTDINENIDATLAMLQHEIRDRITIEKHFDKIPPVYCFAGKLNQVFMNLLINAIQSIAEKGTITIETSQIAATAELMIRIKDTGCGIPPEIQEKIFQPFFSTKEVGKGTGLGLYLCYGIIKQHNGTITLESSAGMGSVFEILIPLNNPKNS